MTRNVSLRVSLLTERNHAATAAEVHFRVLLWIQSQNDPRAEDLAGFIGCSRATAFRYLAAWRRATGQPEISRRHRKPATKTRPRKDRAAHPWNQPALPR